MNICLYRQALEPVVHGRGRKTDSMDETYMGVYENLLYARKINPVEGMFHPLADVVSFTYPRFILIHFL